EEGVTYQRPAGDLSVGGGDPIGTFRRTTGGDNYIAKWTGYITDAFTLSALYGYGKYSRGNENSNSEDCPYILDGRNAGTPPIGVAGCYIDYDMRIPDAGDTRKAFRVDGEWLLGDHTLRFGLD